MTSNILSDVCIFNHIKLIYDKPNFKLDFCLSNKASY